MIPLKDLETYSHVENYTTHVNEYMQYNFTNSGDNEKGYFMTTSEIKSFLEQKYDKIFSKRAIGLYLRGNNFKRITYKSRYGYIVYLNDH